MSRCRIPTAVLTADVLGQAPRDGFDWLDAGLGAAMALGIAMVSTGVVVGVRRRSQRRKRRRAGGRLRRPHR